MSIDRVREAVLAGDLPGLVATLAPEVVFHRPATMRPVVGREAVAELLGALFAVFEDFRYVAQLSGGDNDGEPVHGLVFRARVGGEEVEGIDLVTLNPAGQIVNFAVMMRPLAGVLAIADAVGAHMVATAGSVQ